MSRHSIRRLAVVFAFLTLPLSVATGALAATDAAAGGLPYKKMFVTSTNGTGDLASWTENTTPPSGLTGVEAGDKICQVRAEAAGIAAAGVPVFRAWLSDDTTEAYCHVQGLTGNRDDVAPCDGGTLIGGGPWVRLDGLPFSHELEELVDGAAIHQPSIDETGAELPTPAEPWTGTYGTGTRQAQRCAEWTSGDSGDVGALGKSFNVGVWSGIGLTWGCHHFLPIFCFEQGTGPAPPGPTPAPGALAFVTSKLGPGDLGDAAWLPESDGLTGLAAADAICGNLAADAALPNPSSFVAWLSTSTVDAIDRLTLDGPWKGLDGWPIADSKADLTDSSLATAIRLDESGGNRANSYYLTGSGSDGTYIGQLTKNCQDWTVSNADDSILGAAGEIDEYWTTGILSSCEFSRRLACFSDVELLGWDNFETGNLRRWSAAVGGP